MVVDWRAPISAPFYRATAIDPLDVTFRRRFTLAEGDLTAYLDEHLDDPDATDVGDGHPRPGAGRDRCRAVRRDARDRRHDPGRAGPRDPCPDRPGADRAGRPGHGQDRRRAAPRRLPAVRAPAAARPRRRARRRPQPGVPRLHRATSCRRSASAACASARRSSCASRRSSSPASTTPTLARWKGDAERLVELEQLALDAIRPPDDDVRVPIGARTHVFEAASDRASGCTPPSAASCPINQRRERLRVLAQQELRRRCGGDDRWADAGAAQVGAQRVLADAEAGHARRPLPARARAARSGVGRPPTSTSSTRPTRSSTARRSRTPTSWSTRRRTTPRSRCASSVGARPRGRSRSSATSPSPPRRPVRSGGPTCSRTSASSG